MTSYSPHAFLVEQHCDENVLHSVTASLSVFSVKDFLAHESYRPSICLCVCPSVFSRVDKSKSIEVWIMQLSLQVAQSL